MSVLRRILRRLKRQAPPSFYLGEVIVAPRRGLSRFFETTFLGGATSSQLREFVVDWLKLPEVSTNQAPAKNDCALDITITDYRFGQAIAGDPFIFAFWRPMVKLSCRVREIRSGDVITTISITHKTSWAEYWKRICSWRFVLFPTSAATRTDMAQLVGEGLLQILGRLKVAL